MATADLLTLTADELMRIAKAAKEHEAELVQIHERMSGLTEFYWKGPADDHWRVLAVMDHGELEIE